MDATEVNTLTTKTRMKVLSANVREVTRSFRTRVLDELIASERSYIYYLNVLLEYFVVPMRDRGIVTPKQLGVIFGQIESIKKVNEELLKRLECHGDSVGRVFLDVLPYFKMYCSYANGFEDATVLIQRLLKDEREFATFVSGRETRPEVGMKLNSLLIMPVQRIPRYKLLLEELLHYSDVHSDHYDLLRVALQEVDRVAVLINERLSEHENMRKMLNLQRSLVGHQPKIVIPGRKLIKEGALMKVSRKGDASHPRMFFLFSDMLLYCKQRGSDYARPNSLSCRCILPIKHCRVETLFNCGQKTGTLLKLSCEDETLLLYTDDVAYGDSWVEALRSTVSQFLEYRRTLRKESSAKRPLRRAALLKQKEESISNLTRKRPVDRHSPQMPDHHNRFESLFPSQEFSKLQECLPPRKKCKPCVTS